MGWLEDEAAALKKNKGASAPTEKPVAKKKTPAKKKKTTSTRGKK